MILTAQPKQFSVKDDGQIYFQPDATNPLPGDPVAILAKGSSMLQPGIELLSSTRSLPEGEQAIAGHIQAWLSSHIHTVLEPLFTLIADETLPEAARGIATQVFEGTGIIPRGQVEDLIATLDTEGRQALRSKKVKLGPLLIFLPDLNKPAAVRLRALLWSLYNGQPLPAPVPRDGAMSAVIDPATANPDFYRAIGYPVYGTRAVRIDMLDRVINSVYDSAKDGKFQARHAQAEWMGVPIADLYSVLEAMGHRRIVTPEPAAVTEAPAAAIPSDPIEAIAQPSAEEAPKPQAKPELDWFFLRRGKVHQEQAARAPRQARPDSDKKDFRKKDSKRKEGAKKVARFDKDQRPKEKVQPRVYSAEAQTEDNPFAVLKSLKLK
jgi:ATP-dependent RNA helicase SUPV3L1/SUV3